MSVPAGGLRHNDKAYRRQWSAVDRIAYLLFWGILLWTSPNVVSIPARGIIDAESRAEEIT